jgi:hypothetical protein
MELEIVERFVGVLGRLLVAVLDQEVSSEVGLHVVPGPFVSYHFRKPVTPNILALLLDRRVVKESFQLGTISKLWKWRQSLLRSLLIIIFASRFL